MNQEKVGLFIAKGRKDANMTQMQFAEKLGITNKAVSKWETGKCLPDAALFSDICILINCTINELFAGEKIMPEETEEKAEENLISLAIEYQRRNYKTNVIKFAMPLLVLICISINISVGGMWLEGSPVFTNLLFTVLVVVAWMLYIKLNYDKKASQIISMVFSMAILISSIVSFILAFWDINSHIVFWIGIPCELLFYGFRFAFGWIHIYLIAAILSLLSFAYAKRNLNKIGK